jgi:hypothetical protein
MINETQNKQTKICTHKQYHQALSKYEYHYKNRSANTVDNIFISLEKGAHMLDRDRQYNITVSSREFSLEDGDLSILKAGIKYAQTNGIEVGYPSYTRLPGFISVVNGTLSEYLTKKPGWFTFYNNFICPTVEELQESIDKISLLQSSLDERLQEKEKNIYNELLETMRSTKLERRLKMIGGSE